MCLLLLVRFIESKKMSKLASLDGEPPKKKKYFCKFLDEWLKVEAYKEWLRKIDTDMAECRKCNTKFTIKHDGEKAVKAHMKSVTHIKTTQSIQTNQLMTAFMPVKGM